MQPGGGPTEKSRPWCTVENLSLVYIPQITLGRLPEKGMTLIPVPSISKGTLSSITCHLNAGTCS